MCEDGSLGSLINCLIYLTAQHLDPSQADQKVEFLTLLRRPSDIMYITHFKHADGY